MAMDARSQRVRLLLRIPRARFPPRAMSQRRVVGVPPVVAGEAVVPVGVAVAPVVGLLVVVVAVTRAAALLSASRVMKGRMIVRTYVDDSTAIATEMRRGTTTYAMSVSGTTGKARAIAVRAAMLNPTATDPRSSIAVSTSREGSRGGALSWRLRRRFLQAGSSPLLPGIEVGGVAGS
ncbi:hypothetical protein BU23DRAFT_32101 [Bimuria novae-zelandiae CBS 107.79]|uniref:Uncharacterized protein n=1 Tax=Bimuria novae-zelandiae CBS 107.79 TaxID=1447943 RepID=A0A6A5VTV6_9PLEO|nr:hypothetical protein BU23DRAFT_32101 [Bimuria novae-zelandiae CBS 107.79]